jgi:hypothetical protein
MLVKVFFLKSGFHIHIIRSSRLELLVAAKKQALKE